jgi:hypothetical protein
MGDFVAHYWPVLFYVPAVLVLLATLSFITRVMDNREHKRMREQR